MPPLSQIHIDTALTNLSLLYKNDTYVADMVLPVLPVTKRTDKYFVYDKAGFLSTTGINTVNSRPNSLRRPGSEASEVDHTISTNNYTAEEYALRDIVPDAEAIYADQPIDPEIDVTLELTERLKIDNELAVATITGTRANYATANKATLTTSTTSWKAYASATSNPFNDIVNAKIAINSGIAREPNHLLLNQPAARVLADHPLHKDLVKYTHPEALTMSGLLMKIRGLTIVEAPAQRNVAAEGAAYSGGAIWQNDISQDLALFYYADPAPRPRTICFGFTFEAPDDTTGSRGFSVRKWREEKRKGMMIEVSILRDWKITAVDTAASNLAVGGYLLSGVTL